MKAFPDLQSVTSGPSVRRNSSSFRTRGPFRRGMVYLCFQPCLNYPEIRTVLDRSGADVAFSLFAYDEIPRAVQMDRVAEENLADLFPELLENHGFRNISRWTSSGTCRSSHRPEFLGDHRTCVRARLKRQVQTCPDRDGIREGTVRPCEDMPCGMWITDFQNGHTLHIPFPSGAS